MRTGVGWLSVLLLFSAPASADSDPPVSPPSAASDVSARQRTPLVDDWRFRFGPLADAPSDPGFKDDDWDRITVPHSWNRVGAYRLSRTAETDARRGVGWYRLRVDAPPAAPGERRFLDFGAVGTIADVWVNGVHVGQHRGAFSRFRFDVTAAWRPGAVNVVAVKADNSAPAIGATTENVIPLSGDFFVPGGIYRGVSLISRGEVGIDLLDHGGPGVYARTQSLTPGRAEIGVTARLSNAGAQTRRIELVTIIRDAEGREAVRASQPVALKPGSAEMQETLAVASPRLWDGRRDPYLYSVTVETREGGRATDRVTQALGLRAIRFDADEGFFLNGARLKLRGASRHQDRLGEGWALSRADHAEDMAFFVEMGANAVRQSHYQHADEWSEEADRRGMIVWAEIPYVNAASLAGGAGSDALWENAVEQLRELIRQGWNHPSIAMWSVGNEVDSVAGPGPSGEPRRSRPLLERLAREAREADPSRPTIFADCCETRPGSETLAGTTGLIGYNRYHGWYYTAPRDARAALGAELDLLHQRHPRLPISVSEYGAGGAVSQHSDDPLGGLPSIAGRPQPEEFESFIHEQSWPAIRDRRFVFGAFVWNMFDFATAREEGDSVDLNTKGLVTADRKTRKDAFYYYKAQWAPEPMIHLTGKRYVEPAYPVMEVKAYSNADKAALTLNGAAIGEAPCADRICRWPNVRLAPGPNEAVVTANIAGVAISDHASWIGPDLGDGLRIDSGDIVGRVIGGRRFGSDTFVSGGAPAGPDIGARRDATPPPIEAARPELYEHWREGSAFSYAIPLPDGCWMATAHTFEPRADAIDGAVLTVTSDGVVVLPALDVVKAAGGPRKGVARSFPATAKHGVLKLDFSATGGDAALAAIEIAGRC